MAKKIRATWHCGNGRTHNKVTGITKLNDTEKILVLHPKFTGSIIETEDIVVLNDFVIQTLIITEIIQVFPSSVSKGAHAFKVKVKKLINQTTLPLATQIV